MYMQINFQTYNIYSSQNYPPNFGAKGMPLDLKYIIGKRGYILPERIRLAAQKLIAEGKDKGVSLLSIHKSIYEPILQCKTMDEVKNLYPEFRDVLPAVPIQKKSVNSPGRTLKNFGLRVLQEYWGRLKTKDEIAKLLGMNNRTSLDFSLKKINFKGYETNYKTMLKASDAAGNKEITDKTKAWNKANPEIRQQLNKHAAQGCKTDKYRAAQAQRMFDYDKLHPERRQKISAFSQQMWDNCPEVKTALSDFGKTQGTPWQALMSKHARKEKLSIQEKRMVAIFFKRFWTAHPELKTVLSRASEIVRSEKF